ncbi:hypothetical protein F2Q68_00022543 [Brassica cretica]|uniref:Uncharacterized protein n=2 Tax=Brassica cretica TaxID=69181 RepID=A0ABQ7CPV1_BRACR|nr:hypothetical protein F2Q68_00022543 [Brassica cretica]KAF3562047.1 hypothetical protein DY000_02018723 [Brassica cretica]
MCRPRPMQKTNLNPKRIVRSTRTHPRPAAIGIPPRATQEQTWRLDIDASSTQDQQQ